MALVKDHQVLNHVWWLMPRTPAFRRLGLDDCHEFTASLGYIVSSWLGLCLKTKQNENEKKMMFSIHVIKLPVCLQKVSDERLLKDLEQIIKIILGCPEGS